LEEKGRKKSRDNSEYLIRHFTKAYVKHITITTKMYNNYLKCIVDQLNLETLTFKSDPRYTDILEHVSVYQGSEYLFLIYTQFPNAISTMKEFIYKNDSIGNPNKVQYGDMICSPTSLRYVYHSHLILNHARRCGLTELDVVEVGAGYGGLCFAIHFFSSSFGINVKSYTLIDLPLANKLQERVLTMLNITDATLSFCSSDTFGKDVKEGSFLISNYAFSEIPLSLQENYVKILFPKIQHGFIAWNFIPVYDFGKLILSNEPESPKTGDYNRYIYF
jgi:hypothetical protein